MLCVIVMLVHVDDDSGIGRSKGHRRRRDAPPPPDEWPSCIRMVPQGESPRSNGGNRKSDSKDGRDCISVITAEGAVIGR